MRAELAGRVGILLLGMLLTGNISSRELHKSARTTSLRRASNHQGNLVPGSKPQASSLKLQATSYKHRFAWRLRGNKLQATSYKQSLIIVKLQAASNKLQASSVRRSVDQHSLDVRPIVAGRARRFAVIGEKTEDRGAWIKFY